MSNQTLTEEQYNALPDDQKHFWKEWTDFDGEIKYDPVQINLADAEAVLQELLKTEQANLKFAKSHKHDEGIREATYVIYILTTALDKLKEKGR